MAAGSLRAVNSLARLPLNNIRICSRSLHASGRWRLQAVTYKQDNNIDQGKNFKTKDDIHLMPNRTVVIPKRTILTSFIPGPLRSPRRKKYAERRLLGYSMEDIYAVVADVDDYKNFVPWCRNSSTFGRKPGHFKARICVGFPPLLSENYTSIVTVVPPNLVKSECTDGEMFNYMKTVWQFSPGVHGNPNTCTLNFNVEFEFRSAIHSQLSTVFFDEVVKKMVRAFEKRCQYLYGPDHLCEAIKSRSAQPNPR
ncbi:coenzyme Q-binding protein COQ10 homolog B, mitochondrial [Exaiptasia diaphana]|uniref:Coenzyme Q-binding protein COQ10 START domain-containing protein n=1 Tax=Exaiptasia diaphana TaxID=2652724 RepID=A0A913WRP4_EXADI|nr:coenzyme Q-binding protein COQ10 homolog B, mitochondrial [Exaiptasia diaphana]KXJ27981.1 Coenzyme Q-binding protein COQ10-like B, mitochondrial [Exaiptasia diaphana]